MSDDTKEPVEPQGAKLVRLMREWMSSPAGRAALNHATLKLPANQAVYLSNRIQSAYTAGWDARAAAPAAPQGEQRPSYEQLYKMWKRASDFSHCQTQRLDRIIEAGLVDDDTLDDPVPRAPQGWQPIERMTGHPVVLVSRPTGRLRHEATTAFLDATNVWRVFRSEGGMTPLPFEPTHFMPLPEPPREGSTGSEVSADHGASELDLPEFLRNHAE